MALETNPSPFTGAQVSGLAIDISIDSHITNTSRLTLSTNRSRTSYSNPIGSSTAVQTLAPLPTTTAMLTSRRPLSTSPTAALYTTSNFPATLDNFTTVTPGQTVSSKEFIELVQAVQSVQNKLSPLTKASPGDISKRLSGRIIGPITAGGTGTSSGLRLLGGSQSSSVRSPIIVSLGGEIVFSGGERFSSIDLSLSSAQKAVLGITSTITAVQGLTFLTGCKLQVPSGAVIALATPQTAATVLARVDDSGTVRLLLRVTSTNSSFTFAPGRWYVYIMFIRSAYSWS